MAGGHKMIGATCTVPVRVFIRYDVNIIRENANETVTSVSGNGLVDIVHDVNYAYGQEENMGLIRMLGRKWAFSVVHFVDEMALY